MNIKYHDPLHKRNSSGAGYVNENSFNGIDFTSVVRSKDKDSKRKYLASQKMIIREVFSPPVKNKKRRHKPSYDGKSNYGTAEISSHSRNNTPNIGAMKSFDYVKSRNFTSEGSAGRSVPQNNVSILCHNLTLILIGVYCCAYRQI